MYSLVIVNRYGVAVKVVTRKTPQECERDRYKTFHTCSKCGHKLMDTYLLCGAVKVGEQVVQR